MADAYILETGLETAGIVVVEGRDLRFYASEAAFNSIDGQTFRSLKAARKAVDVLSRQALSARRFGVAPGFGGYSQAA